MGTLLKQLEDCPVIAAVRCDADLAVALESRSKVLFILGGDLSSLAQTVGRVRAKGRLGLLHIDLLEGLGKDDSAVRYLARSIGADGIVSTRANLIRKAKAEGMQAVQRIFLVDSASVETGVKMAQQSDCDAVEVMPGLVFPEIRDRLAPVLPTPIIAGGLVTEASQVSRILSSGAVGVSTGRRELWSLYAGIRDVRGP